MTTRSGAHYKMSADDTTTRDSHPESTSTGSTLSGAGPDLITVMQMFLEDHQWLERELAEECRRHDRDMEECVREMQHQMAELYSLGTGRARTESGTDTLKLTKLSVTNDIEAYLTTFERLMRHLRYSRGTLGPETGPATDRQSAASLCSYGTRSRYRLLSDESGHPSPI